MSNKIQFQGLSTPIEIKKISVAKIGSKTYRSAHSAADNLIMEEFRIWCPTIHLHNFTPAQEEKALQLREALISEFKSKGLK